MIKKDGGDVGGTKRNTEMRWKETRRKRQRQKTKVKTKMKRMELSHSLEGVWGSYCEHLQAGKLPIVPLVKVQAVLQK